MEKEKQKDHPEISDIKNICEVSPHTKSTSDVCDKLQNDHPHKTPNKKQKGHK
jgi:hypothetical protein